MKTKPTYTHLEEISSPHHCELLTRRLLTGETVPELGRRFRMEPTAVCEGIYHAYTELLFVLKHEAQRDAVDAAEVHNRAASLENVIAEINGERDAQSMLLLELNFL